MATEKKEKDGEKNVIAFQKAFTEAIIKENKVHYSHTQFHTVIL